jgi:hypothetical protein
MHKYVWGWLGLWIVFLATFALAIQRVSQTPKYASQPFNSKTCDGKIPEKRVVVKWLSTCSTMKVTPK